MNENWNPAGNPRVSEPRLASADDPVRLDSDDVYGRFETLTKKLVGVPKGEVDELREARPQERPVNSA